MDDLIRRQAVIDIIHKEIERTSSFSEHETQINIEMAVKELPTAYDVSKVVVELEKRRANCDCRYCKYNKTETQVCRQDCTDALIDDLLDIVKRGGWNEEKNTNKNR